MQHTAMLDWMNTFDTVDKSWSYWVKLNSVATDMAISVTADTDQNPQVEL
jgi:hypothetical protein